MIRLAALLLTVPVVADARAMTCTDLIGYWAADVFLIEETEPGVLSISAKGSDSNTLDPISFTVLMSQTANNPNFGDRQSVVATSLNDPAGLYAPTTWLVDWEAPALSHTAFEGSNWYINDQFDCEVVFDGS